MNDAYGLSVRTMDLGPGPAFTLRTQPKGHSAGLNIPPAKYGHLISVGTNVTRLQADGASDMAFAGLNEAGLSCDLHALLNSSYPQIAKGKKNIMLYYFCNWALGSFDSQSANLAADPKYTQLVARLRKELQTAFAPPPTAFRNHAGLESDDGGAAAALAKLGVRWREKMLCHFLIHLGCPVTTWPGPLLCF